MLSIPHHGETDHKVWLCLLLTKRLLLSSEMRSCSDRVQGGKVRRQRLGLEVFSYSAIRGASLLIFQSNSMSSFHCWAIFKTQRHTQEPAQIGFGILFLIYETWVLCIKWLTGYGLFGIPTLVHHCWSLFKQVCSVHDMLASFNWGKTWDWWFFSHFNLIWHQRIGVCSMESKWMIDKRSKAASSPAQRTLIMKDTLSASVAYGRQEISSPSGFCTIFF